MNDTMTWTHPAPRRPWLPALAVAGIALTGACDPNAPTEQDYDDVAAGLAALVVDGDGGGDTGSMVEAAALARGDVPAGVNLVAEGVYEGEHGGLTYRYELTCLDEAGRVVLTCSEDRTDTARVDVDWSGEVDLPRFQGAVERTGSWTLSNLRSGVARFDGEGTFDVDAAWQSARTMGEWSLDYDASYDAIQLDLDTMSVVGGDARWQVDARRFRRGVRRTVEVELSITAELGFDDEGNPVLTLDGDRVYDIDAGTGVATRR